MNFSFHPEAEAEFYDAINFYEDCESGLGEAFSHEVFAAIGRILRFPESWQNFPVDHEDASATASHTPSFIVSREKRS